MCALNLDDVRVARALECINDTGRIYKLVEGAILRRFLFLALRVWQRCRNGTLLFLSVDIILVQALLLLLDKSFLKRHLLLQV